MQNIISVIIPIYNVEEFIYRAIVSACTQSFKDIEIICIDDCSTDDSFSIVQHLAKEDLRIKAIQNRKHDGVAATRNHGLTLACGSYVAFLDGDDYFSPFFLENLYAEAIYSNADIVKAPCQCVYIDGTQKNHWENNTAYEAIKKNKFVPFYYNHGFGMSIYRRSMLQKENITFPAITNGEDIVFLFKALLSAEKISVIDNAYYYYWQRPNSASYTLTEESVKSILQHYKMLIEIINNKNIDPVNYAEFYDLKILYPLTTWRYTEIMEKNFSKSFRFFYRQKIKEFYLNCKYPIYLPHNSHFKIFLRFPFFSFKNKKLLSKIKILLRPIFNMFPPHVKLYIKKIIKNTYM